MIDLKTFGIVPNTGKDMSTEFIALFKYCKENTVSSVRLEKGIYDFFEPLRINLNLADASPDGNISRDFALILSEMKDFLLDGRGSTFLMHGNMSALLINSCSEITIKNLGIDYAVAPTVTLTVIEQEKNRIVLRSSVPYSIVDKKRLSLGENLFPLNTDKDFVYSVLDGEGVVRTEKNLFASAKKIVPFGEGFVEIKLGAPCKELKNGDCIAVPFNKNKSFGTVINKSTETVLTNVAFFQAGNSAVFAQDSKRLSFHQVKLAPTSIGSFVCTGDGIKLVECGGRIQIENSVFEGIGGNAVSVANEYYTVTNVDGSEVEAVPANPYTYSRIPFEDGDLTEVYEIYGQEKMTQSSIIKLRKNVNVLTLMLRGVLHIKKGDALLNGSKEPLLEIYNNSFKKVSKSAVLVAVAKEILLIGNSFSDIGASGIHIGGDEINGGQVMKATVLKNDFSKIQQGISVLPYGSESGDFHICKELVSEDNLL